MHLSPEWHFILSCAKANLPSQEFTRRWRPYLETIDWDHLTALSCRHGIAPLIYHSLLQIEGVSGRPQLDGLRRTYYGNWARNTLLYKDLSDVLSALQTMGSQIVVLKGAALAETVYPHRALRPMSDIDLLVRSEEMARIENRLRDLGYAACLHPRGDAWLKAHHYHLSFAKVEATTSDIPLEIHWHIDRPSRPYTIDLEGMWARAVPARIAGVDSWIFSPEDLLLHMGLHACKHRLTGSLRPLCDIAATVLRYGHTLDWEQLQTRACHWRIAPYVYLPLRLARDLVGAAVPDPVLRALKPDGLDPQLVRWATVALLENRVRTALFPELLALWKGPGVRDRLAIVAKTLSPAAVAKSYRVPPTSRRRYGYYPMRLRDLVRRYGPTLWRLFRRDQQLVELAEARSQLAQWLQPFDRKHDQPVQRVKSDSGLP